MIWLFCTEALIGMLLVMELLHTRGSGRGKHQKCVCASVLALGDAETPSPCRMAGVLRSGIHLVSSRPVRAGNQLQSQRGEECFVDDMRYMAAREDGYFLDTGVFASNDRPLGPVALVRQALARCVVYLMRQFAIRVLGAQWRPRRD
jgi:hypothetical protein